MSNYIGAATIKLGADTKQLQQDLAGAQTKTVGAMKNIGKASAAAAASIATAAFAASVELVKGITKQSVELYSSFEQSVGGAETLFKDAADTVLANADRAFETAGISANAYLEQANSLAGSLLQSTGGNAAKAAELADRAMQSMSDNSAKIGTDIQMIQDAYQSMARGQFVLLDNLKLGYGGTKSEMERLIADASQMTEEMNKLGVTVDATSMDFGNMVNAIAVVQEHMGIAGTTIEEAYNTIAGSQKMFQAAKEDFIRGLADPNADIGALFDKASKAAMAYAKNLGATIKRLLPNIANAVRDVIGAIAEALPDIINEFIPMLATTVLDVMVVLLDNLPAIIDALVQAMDKIVLAIMERLPQILTSLTQAILSIFVALTSPENMQVAIQCMIMLFTAIIQALPQILEQLALAQEEIITNLVDFLTDPVTIETVLIAGFELFKALVSAVPKILDLLISAWGDLFSKLWETLKTNFTEFAGKFGKGIGNALINAINGMLGFIQDFLNGPINAINGALSALNQIPGVNIGQLSTITIGRIPALAAGGLVTSPTTALIGEAGPEAVIPLRNTNSWAKAIATALSEEFASDELSGGRTVNIYMTNQINNKLDINEVSQELTTLIRRTI